jgi:tetratricopeptide (TPR) repeat protein
MAMDINAVERHREHHDMHLSQQQAMQLLGALCAQDKHREARTLSQAILRHFPASPVQTETLDLLAGALMQSGEYAEALTVLARSIALEPELPRHHHRKGECLLAAGNISAAQTAFTAALQLAADHPGTRVRLASCLLLQGQVEPALALCRDALAADPQSFEAQHLCGCCLYQLGLAETAVLHLERCIDLQPAHVAVRQQLAGILLQLGRADPALHHYETALLCDPANLTLMRTLAETLLLLGRFAAADVYLDRLLILSPDDATLRLLRGQLLERQDRTLEALAFYTEAARNDACTRDACYLMMVALHKLERHDEALRCCRLVLQYGDDYRDTRAYEARLLEGASCR